MRRCDWLKWAVPLVVLVLGAVPAQATTYTAARNGKFDASDVDTWGAGMGVYPDDATDDAIIGTYEVQVYNDVPDLAATGITVNSGGTLFNRVSQTGTNAVTVNNSGLMRFYSSWNNYKDAPNWTVTMNDGGKTHIDDMRAGLTTTFVLSDNASATIRCNGGNGDNQPNITGTISGPATATLTVTALNSVQYNSRIRFGGDNSGLLSGVVLDHVYYEHNHTNALGPATASAVEVKNGAVVRVARGYKHGDRQMIRDLDVYDGSLASKAHNAYEVTWPSTVTLMNDTTFGLSATGTYDYGRIWFNGQITEDATPRALTVNTTGSSAYRGRGTLNNSTNDFTGGLHVKGGRLMVGAAGACGDGDVIVYGGAELQVEVTNGVDPDNVVYLLSGSKGLLDLDADCTVQSLNLGGTWDDVEGAVVGGEWVDPGSYTDLAIVAYQSQFEGYVEFDGNWLTVLSTPAPINEPAGLGLVGLALLGLRKRTRRG
jgi:hypothetical protein